MRLPYAFFVGLFLGLIATAPLARADKATCYGANRGPPCDVQKADGGVVQRLAVDTYHYADGGLGCNVTVCADTNVVSVLADGGTGATARGDTTCMAQVVLLPPDSAFCSSFQGQAQTKGLALWYSDQRL
jgi:hypothetical protein